MYMNLFVFYLFLFMEFSGNTYLLSKQKEKPFNTYNYGTRNKT